MKNCKQMWLKKKFFLMRKIKPKLSDAWYWERYREQQLYENPPLPLHVVTIKFTTKIIRKLKFCRIFMSFNGNRFEY